MYIYFFKKAKGRTSQSGYFFRGPYFIFHLLSCHGGAHLRELTQEPYVRHLDPKLSCLLGKKTKKEELMTYCCCSLF